MSVTPGFILTTAGAAAFAASVSGAPVPISTMAFGDANGVGYTPSGNETGLQHEVSRVPVDSVVRDPADNRQLIVTATLGPAAGGYKVREIGVFTADGKLAMIGPANLYKSLAADGVVTTFETKVVVVVSPSSKVVVKLPDAAAVTADYVLSQAQFFAFTSATVAAPPPAPAPDAIYLIPQGATGDWAARGGQIARWRGGAEGWLYISPATGSQGNVADNGALSYRLNANGWVAVPVGFSSEAVTPSAPTVDLGMLRRHVAAITGGVTVLSFGASASTDTCIYLVRIVDGLRLVASASLILPGRSDIVAGAGDSLMAKYEGGGVWRVLIYQPAGGYDPAGAAVTEANAALRSAKAYTNGAVGGLAPLSSPEFVNTPTAPTAPVGTNTGQLATMAALQQAIAALIGLAPAALDTWGELVGAIQADETALSVLTTLIATKVDAPYVESVGLRLAAGVFLENTTAATFAIPATARGGLVVNYVAGAVAVLPPTTAVADGALYTIFNSSTGAAAASRADTGEGFLGGAGIQAGDTLAIPPQATLICTVENGFWRPVVDPRAIALGDAATLAAAKLYADAAAASAAAGAGQEAFFYGMM